MYMIWAFKAQAVLIFKFYAYFMSETNEKSSKMNQTLQFYWSFLVHTTGGPPLRRKNGRRIKPKPS